MNEVRCWLLIEIIFFLAWILVSVCYLMIAYCLKLKSIAKNEAMLMIDDDVWNDKDTDDFLRYLKYDYFVMVLPMTFLAMELTLGFLEFNDTHLFGPRDFASTGTIFVLLMGIRSYQFIYNIF
jgi:cbb3-type cytochrome oxidase subunit 3